MTYEERWQHLAKLKKLNTRQFCLSINISQQGLSGLIERETFPNTEKTKALIELFPNLNLNWLFFGTGEVFFNENLLPSPSTEENLNRTLTEPEQKSTVEVAKKKHNNRKVEVSESWLHSLERRLEAVEKHSPHRQRIAG